MSTENDTLTFTKPSTSIDASNASSALDVSNASNASSALTGANSVGTNAAKSGKVQSGPNAKRKRQKNSNQQKGKKRKTAVQNETRPQKQKKQNLELTLPCDGFGFRLASWANKLHAEIQKRWQKVRPAVDLDVRARSVEQLGGDEWAHDCERYLFYRYYLVDRDQYARRCLAVATNLKLNPALHNLPARSVACMADNQFLHNSELRQRQPIVRPSKRKERNSGIKCIKCFFKKRNCYDTEWQTMQTRSADEPATVFVYCFQCNRRWVHS